MSDEAQADGEFQFLMRQILFARRRESALLLVTVVIVALLVSLLANALTAQLYSSHPKLFVGLVLAGLAASIAALYGFVLARREFGVEAAKFVYVFDRTVPAFVDIPGAFPSVRMRVHFQRLGHERGLQLAKGDSMDEFFGSEFARFVNEATEASLLSLMFGLKWHATEANHRAIRRSELPKTLRRNECLARDQREEIDSELFYLPLWAEFIDDEQRDWGIKVKTPFGSVSVDWEISWANDAWYAEAYLAATGHLKGRDTHEIVAQVRLHYDCRFLRLHSQKLKEYVSWTGRLAEELRQLDWKSTETRLTFEILQALNAKLDAQRTRTPPAL